MSYCNVTFFPAVQENGQIKVWCNSLNCEPNGKNCEIVVKNIPRILNIEDVFKLFYKSKETFSMRLMMDFSGSNRGYAFIKYMNPASARDAIVKFNGYQMRGCSLKVELSLENCRLYVANIPKELKKEEILVAFSNLTGLLSIIFLQDRAIPSKNRGYAFFEFSNHHYASVARKVIPNIMYSKWKIIGPFITWAICENTIPESVMSKVTVVFIRGLDAAKTTNRDVECLVSLAVAKTAIYYIKHHGHFAFIHAKSRRAAEKIILTLNGMRFYGNQIEATFARPKNGLPKQIARKTEED